MKCWTKLRKGLVKMSQTYQICPEVDSCRQSHATIVPDDRAGKMFADWKGMKEKGWRCGISCVEKCKSLIFSLGSTRTIYYMGNFATRNMEHTHPRGK